MDRGDHELLKRLNAGERVFKQKDGQPYEDFEREVLRLLRLRDRGLITMMPDPSSASMNGRNEYRASGACDLTLEGHEALDRYQP